MIFNLQYDGLNRHRLLGPIRASFVMISSVLSSAIMWMVFMTLAALMMSFRGLNLKTYALVGLLYSLTVGRHWIRYTSKICSLLSLPILIPSYFIYYESQWGFWGMNDLICFAVGFLIISSPWSQSAKRVQPIFIQQKNRLFLIILQIFWGVLIQYCYPDFLERPQWATIGFFQQGQLYPYSYENFRLYYEDKAEADKIHDLLPEVLELVKTIPFYRPNLTLVLCQKSNFIYPDQPSEELNKKILGHYHPWKNYSYVYFSKDKELELKDYKAIMAHELTHQIVYNFYGVWQRFYRTIPLWKHEGYAEYIAHQSEDFSKSQWLALIEAESDLAEKLGSPFSPNSKKSDYFYEDYQAALLQTYYALDEKKIDPKDFFKNNYTLADEQEIKEWLYLAQKAS